MNRPYYILSPGYQHNSGGIKVLFELCDKLNELGEEAYIVTDRFESKKNTKQIFARGIKHKDAIAVYPEIYKGNPLRMPTVARWVLNSPGKIGGDKVYDHNEKVFSFYELYNKDIRNKIAGMLYVPTIETAIFNTVDREPNNTCYYVGKGPYRENCNIPTDAIEITRSWPSNRYMLAEIFKTSKVFYCFDYSTQMTQEAALCGCPTVLLSGNLAEHKKSLFYGYGCCDDINKIDEAISTVHKVKERLDELSKESVEQIKKFIQITQGG